MAKPIPQEEAPTTPVLLMSRFTPEFIECEYTVSLNGAFDVGKFIETAAAEAGVKGMAVMVQIALIPYSWLYGENQEEDKEESKDE